MSEVTLKSYLRYNKLSKLHARSSKGFATLRLSKTPDLSNVFESSTAQTPHCGVCYAQDDTLTVDKVTGISPLANTPTPYALQASLQIFGWGVRTRVCTLRSLAKRRGEINAQTGSHVPVPNRKPTPFRGGLSVLQPFCPLKKHRR